MTVERARVILGKQAEGLSDQEIEAIIAKETHLCKALLPVFESCLTNCKSNNNNGYRPC